MLSTVVTTLDDDPNYVLPQDQDLVTLRDAIETVNNGDGLGQAGGDSPATMSGNTLNVQPMQAGGGGVQVLFLQGLSGTINLAAELPVLANNVTIVGPGFNTLTIKGNGNAGNPYRIWASSQAAT